MATHLSEDELREILAKQKPGLRLSKSAPEPDEAPLLEGLLATPELPLARPAATTASKKKLGSGSARVTRWRAGGGGEEEEEEEVEEEEEEELGSPFGDPPDDDVQTVLVEPLSANVVDAAEVAPPRVLLISKSKRKIIGEQG